MAKIPERGHSLAMVFNPFWRVLANYVHITACVADADTQHTLLVETG